MKICSKCGEEKPLSSFYKKRDNKGTRCKSCHANLGPDSRFNSSWYTERFTSEELELFTVLKNLCTKAKFRNQEYDDSVDWQYLFEIWDSQNGRCIYSGVPLSIETNHPHKVSLDRVNSKVGYCRGNLQLVSAAVNRMKQEFDEDFFLDMCVNIASYSKTTH